MEFLIWDQESWDQFWKYLQTLLSIIEHDGVKLYLSPEAPRDFWMGDGESAIMMMVAVYFAQWFILM